MDTKPSESAIDVARYLCDLYGVGHSDPPTRNAVARYIDAFADARVREAVRADREACAKACEIGYAHTYASENADIYRAYDRAWETCVDLIRFRAAQPGGET